jgi:hypothetical protein
MKICFLSDPYTQRWGRFFAERGHHVHIVGGRPMDRGRLPGITTHVAARDPEALAGAVVRSMSGEGRRFVAQHYDWRTDAGRIEQLYADPLPGDRGTAGR